MMTIQIVITMFTSAKAMPTISGLPSGQCLFLNISKMKLLVMQLVKKKKNPPAMQEAWVGRSPGEGNGNPLQSSCLENPMDRGAWRATVHRITRVRHDLATTPPPSPHIPVSEMLKCETKVLLRIGEI